MLKKIVKKIFSLLGYEIKKIQPDLGLIQTKNYIVPYDKINYGSGKRVLKDWINVDFFDIDNNNNFPEQIKVDLTKRHPFADQIFNFGYSEDFLEHLNQADQIIFLEEVYRTFRLGGVLRLSFPGLGGSLSKYYKETSYQGYLIGKQAAFIEHVHFHLPTFQELELICRFIGFSEVRKVNYGESIYQELSNLDTRHDQIGLNIMVEITK